MICKCFGDDCDVGGDMVMSAIFDRNLNLVRGYAKTKEISVCLALLFLVDSSLAPYYFTSYLLSTVW